MAFDVMMAVIDCAGVKLAPGTNAPRLARAFCILALCSCWAKAAVGKAPHAPTELVAMAAAICCWANSARAGCANEVARWFGEYDPMVAADHRAKADADVVGCGFDT